MREIDLEAIRASKDEVFFSEFVNQKKNFIIHSAYRVTHRFISESDDEWSIALIAFSNAIKTYSFKKGSFIPYAELLIKRALIDHFRSNDKFSSEISTNPYLFQSEKNEDEDTSLALKLRTDLSYCHENDIKYEIEAINDILKDLGFSFYDLIKVSPKSEKTKAACKRAVLYILDNPLIMAEFYKTLQLPLKIIEKNTNLPRKILENHRKYIIAAVVILSGEYPLVAEYISFIRKDGE